MAVTYKKHFKLFIDRDLKKQDLEEKAKIGPATISKKAVGDNVTMEVIEKVCRALDVKIDDICELVD